jgi:transcription elongation factor Elf1
MECPRCNGLMIDQAFIPTVSEAETWKCVNCGNIITKKEKFLEYDSFSIFHDQQKEKKNSKTKNS